MLHFTHWRCVVVVAAGLSASGVAHGQGGEDPIPDKSGYHLFNPTPRELRRELSADRPDATESPYTVDAGAVQLEMSFAEFGWRRAGGGSVRSWSIAPVNLKLGVTNSADVQLLINPYESERGGGAGDAEGFGGLGLRVKVNLIGNDEGAFAAALLPYVVFPVGDDEVSPERVEGGVIVPFALDLGGGVGLGWQVQFDFVHEGERRYRTDFSHTLALGCDVAEGVGAYIEYLGEVSLDAGGGYSPSLGGGLTFSLSADAQLDLGAMVGLDDPERDGVVVFAGITLRF